MSIRFRKKLKQNILQRKKHAALELPVSKFTIFLVLFAQTVHFLWIFSTVISETFCHYAAFWVTGWFDFHAPYQWLGLAIISTVAVFGVRTAFLSTHIHAPWETILQGALIGVVSLVFLGQSAFLFPYAYPGATTIGKIFETLSPTELKLIEIEDETQWPFDFPEAPPDPCYNKEYGPYGWKLFKTSISPTWGEYQAMNACFAKYDEEMAAFRKWREEFESWYDNNWYRYD